MFSKHCTRCTRSSWHTCRRRKTPDGHCCTLHQFTKILFESFESIADAVEVHVVHVGVGRHVAVGGLLTVGVVLFANAKIQIFRIISYNFVL